MNNVLEKEKKNDVVGVAMRRVIKFERGMECQPS
jgi:hypothetical protein